MGHTCRAQGPDGSQPRAQPQADPKGDPARHPKAHTQINTHIHGCRLPAAGAPRLCLPARWPESPHSKPGHFYPHPGHLQGHKCGCV